MIKNSTFLSKNKKASKSYCEFSTVYIFVSLLLKPTQGHKECTSMGIASPPSRIRQLQAARKDRRYLRFSKANININTSLLLLLLVSLTLAICTKLKVEKNAASRPYLPYRGVWPWWAQSPFPAMTVKLLVPGCGKQTDIYRGLSELTHSIKPFSNYLDISSPKA